MCVVGREIYVKNDGNCLFRAISKSGKSAQIFNVDHNLLKKHALDWIYRNWEQHPYSHSNTIKQIIQNELQRQFKTRHDYIIYMMVPGQWGGSAELIALSHIFKLDINILMKKNNRYNKINVINFFEEKSSVRQVYIVFDGVHYNAFESSGNCSP